MARLALVWAALAEFVPLYPLYALLFRDAGLSVAEISALFAIWSAVAILAEVPTGALADRFSRRAALAAAGVLQAAGYVLWIVAPGFAGFAAGFMLWGLGGALSSGALEALVYDGLACLRAEDRFAALNGRITAVQLLAQIPGGLAASALFSLGGYALVGWVSIGSCLAAGVLATRLPETRRDPGEEDEGYLATLRAGIDHVARSRAVAAAVVAVALLGSVDAVEEYFPILTRDVGVPAAAVPAAMLGISLAGAAGAALGGAAARLRPPALAGFLTAGALGLAVAGLVGHPAALAGVAAFYFLYRLVLVVAEARLQERIPNAVRATVTSVAGLGVEVAGMGLFGMWALGGAPAVGAFVLALAVPVAMTLRVRVLG